MNNKPSPSLSAQRCLPVMLQILIALASGGLLILGYPPFNLWPCVLLAWIGLFTVVFNGSPRSVFHLGLAFGFIGYGGALLWLRVIFAAAAVPLYCILAVFVMLPALITCLISNRLGSPWLKVILVASLFAGFEFSRCELFVLKFPWISAGSALGPNWLTPIIGVYGCSFFIFTAAAFIVVRGTRVAGVGLTAMLLGLCTLRPSTVTPGTQDSMKVAVVQGEELSFDEHVKLSKKTFDQSSMLIVCPEYALPYDVRKDEPKQIEAVRQLAQAHDMISVLGTKTKAGKGEQEGDQDTGRLGDIKAFEDLALGTKQGHS